MKFGLFDFFIKKNIQTTIDDDIAKNKLSAQELKWTPSWFQCKDFNSDLITNIKAFQDKCGLSPTGIMDDSTFRRKMTEREADNVRADTIHPVIYCNDKPVSIAWNKVKTFKQPGGFEAPLGSYKKMLSRKPNLFVVHFDVCLSSRSCFDVLKTRGLSVHFLIDNDGTIYQTLDTKHVAWHAKGVNDGSVGVEISNAFYEKYNKTYEQMGLEPRPVITDSKVHGQKIENHLGFYPVQIEAFKALIKALNIGCGIPLDTPVDAAGKQINTVSKDVADSKFKGIVHHFQITTNKIDSVGLDLPNIIKEIK